MFYDNLKAMCKKKGTSPSASALAVGMSKSNVTGWKKGQEPSISTVVKLAKHLNVSVYDLIGDEDGAIDIGLAALNSNKSEKEVQEILEHAEQQKTADTKDDGSNALILKDEQLVRFPIIGSISAGYTSLAVEEYTGDFELIPISNLHCSPKSYFVLRVSGNSMYPRLLDGDRVLVHRVNTVDNGRVAVVLYNGDEATIKKINYDSGKAIDLIPFNPEYQTKHIEGEDLNQCKILGEVVMLLRNM